MIAFAVFCKGLFFSWREWQRGLNCAERHRQIIELRVRGLHEQEARLIGLARI